MLLPGLVPQPANGLLTSPTPGPAAPTRAQGVFTQLGVEKLEEEELHPPGASSLMGMMETAVGGLGGR